MTNQPIIITNHGDTIAQALAPPGHPHHTIQNAEQAYPLLQNQHPHTTIHHLQTNEDTLTITTYPLPDHDPTTRILNWLQPTNTTTTLSLYDPQLTQKIQQHTQ